VVEPLTIEKRASFSLCLASSGDTLVIAQEVWNDGGDGVSEIWATFSEDRGRTWPRKAVYSAMSLFDPSIAFSPDGSLIVAGSLRVDDRSSRPWFLRTGIRARVEEK
jgi:WD40 repeat protein